MFKPFLPYSCSCCFCCFLLTSPYAKFTLEGLSPYLPLAMFVGDRRQKIPSRMGLSSLGHANEFFYTIF